MKFQTLYIEQNVLDHINDTVTTSSNLYYLNIPTAIPIKHYKDIFNERKQHILLQKLYPALILARKTTPFLQLGSLLCQNFNADIFYYAQLALNCPYACSYCYLQGLYKTGNCVLFVNYNDFLCEIETLIHKFPDKHIYIPLTHETDLMAFREGQTLLEFLLPKLQNYKTVQFEVRTKNADIAFLSKINPASNVIFAFSLAPDEIIRSYERLTPSLEARLRTIKTAQELGFAVRICFDPVFIEPGWQPMYHDFYDKVFSSVCENKILDMSFGFFRMPKKIYRYCSTIYPQYYLYNAQYDTSGDDVQYSKRDQQKALIEHRSMLSKYTNIEKVYFVPTEAF